MTVTYLKKADKTPQTGTDETQAIVSEMLSRICLLYTSPSPRDAHESRMPSSA